MSSGTETRVRTRIFPIRLAAEERDAVEAAADRAGLAASSYARQVLLGAPAPRQVRRPPVERRELARLLAEFGRVAGELGKIGSNLNQIARATNSGLVADSVLLQETLAELREPIAGLDEMRDALLRALGREP
ncbi:MAG TPA: MobC family plasmid mobilization relaxosome protein [Rhizomicrobium sp.]|jgi:hypothetical protein